MSDAVQSLPVRLQPGDDLRDALDALLRAHGLQAAFVVAGIGSLSSAQLRLAGAEQATHFDGDIEILSLSGSLSTDGSHLHAAIADAQGRVSGGHVAPGCVVRTTAEVLIAVLPAWRFERVADARTGFADLRVLPSGSES